MGDLKLDFPMIMTTLVGLGLSVYAYTIETRMEEDMEYSPICDIHEHMSCSKAFMSEYGKGFGLLPPTSLLNQPNSVFGLMFYNTAFFLILLASPVASRFLIFLCILANISSVYFAYILIFILHDFCIVCVSCYVVNAALLVQACKRHKLVMNELKPKIQ